MAASFSHSAASSPLLHFRHCPSGLRASTSLILLHPAAPALSPLRLLALRSEQVVCRGAQDPALLRRPWVSSPSPDDDDDDVADEGVEGGRQTRRGEAQGRRKGRRKDDDGDDEDEWVDWEDVILEDTVPLVGFVRMILHSGKYQSGDKLSPEHEKTIMERLLPYHPECQKKIGCGIDFITVGFHPEFENSRCLFLVRKDGELVDFSYWKCIKGLIRKKYPLYADTFILRHFKRRRYLNYYAAAHVCMQFASIPPKSNMASLFPL